MAQKVTPQSGNFITRLNDRLDNWLQRHLPDWLYKQITFQPDRPLRPNNSKLAIVYSLLVIAAAIVILMLCNYDLWLHTSKQGAYTMAKATLSLSLAIETDPETMDQVRQRLDQNLAGRIKDLVAGALTGLDFDLKQQYWLFDLEQPAEEPAARPPQTVPLWSDEAQQMIRVTVGAPEWFTLIEKAGKFYYHYQGLRFTVRRETRQRRGKDYTYWRAYCTVTGKLRAKQLGTTDKLTGENLDEVGAYFASFA